MSSSPVYASITTLSHTRHHTHTTHTSPTHHPHITHSPMLASHCPHAQYQKRFSENKARRIMRPLLAAIKHCHQHRVVHRDLKVTVAFILTLILTSSLILTLSFILISSLMLTFSTHTHSLILNVTPYPPFHSSSPPHSSLLASVGEYSPSNQRRYERRHCHAGRGHVSGGVRV